MSIDLKDFKVTESRSVDFLNEANKVIVGHTRELASVFACLLADGHASLVTMPGLGKTLIAKVVQAGIEGCLRGRIQMVPDMRPSDITGYNIETATGREFRPGPMLKVNVLLIDEINRASPRVLSSLLQALEERFLTIDGVRHDLEDIFISVMTRNDFESAGTYELGDALKDRLLMDIEWGYPSDAEMDEIHSRAVLFDRDPESMIVPSLTITDIRQMQKQVRLLATDGVSPHLKQYITQLTQSCNPAKPQFKQFKTIDGRSFEALVTYGGSPRMAMGLRKAAAAIAFMAGEDKVRVEHVQAVFPDVARAHILMGSLSKVGKHKVSINDFIDAVLRGTPAP
ncbi:MAG: MoxR family ATPase [Cyanobacteria bacterium REEB67]|nr:MoxR family ATPase [Cyanobacteria bacterium REEB67]